MKLGAIQGLDSETDNYIVKFSDYPPLEDESNMTLHVKTYKPGSEHISKREYTVFHDLKITGGGESHILELGALEDPFSVELEVLKIEAEKFRYKAEVEGFVAMKLQQDGKKCHFTVHKASTPEGKRPELTFIPAAEDPDDPPGPGETELDKIRGGTLNLDNHVVIFDEDGNAKVDGTSIEMGAVKKLLNKCGEED